MMRPTTSSTPLLASSFNEFEPQVSPDGQWLAFVSDASGKTEVYVVSLTSANAEPIRLSQAGGETRGGAATAVSSSSSPINGSS